jgi:hypothetical protein
MILPHHRLIDFIEQDTKHAYFEPRMLHLSLEVVVITLVVVEI